MKTFIQQLLLALEHFLAALALLCANANKSLNDTKKKDIPAKKDLASKQSTEKDKEDQTPEQPVISQVVLLIFLLMSLS